MAIMVKSGQVKWFNVSKGFGFITPEDGSADLFFHYTQSMDGDLPAGTAVTFTVYQDHNGGYQAKSVFLDS